MNNYGQWKKKITPRALFFKLSIIYQSFFYVLSSHVFSSINRLRRKLTINKTTNKWLNNNANISFLMTYTGFSLNSISLLYFFEMIKGLTIRFDSSIKQWTNFFKFFLLSWSILKFKQCENLFFMGNFLLIDLSLLKLNWLWHIILRV
jgi:hypothetical protein